MKMTMHIDEELLERVMRDYEFPSKTEAVEAALKELDRQMRIREFRKNGLGLTPEELANAVDPNYDERLGYNVYPKELALAEDEKPADPHGRPDPR
jgi:Bacterial antitoxin of type II TA system, VapB